MINTRNNTSLAGVVILLRPVSWAKVGHYPSEAQESQHSISCGIHGNVRIYPGVSSMFRGGRSNI